MKLSETISLLFEETIQKLMLDNNSIVYSKYCNVLEEDEVLALSQSIEDLLVKEEVDKRVVRKIFHSVVESFQNIRNHGLKSEDGSTFGAFIMVKEQTQFVMHFMNALPAVLYDEFIKSVNFVNGLDKKKLKAHYLQVLKNGKLSEKGGAGLGLMSIALKASGGINIVEIPHNENIYVIKLSYDIHL